MVYDRLSCSERRASQGAMGAERELIGLDLKDATN